MMIMKYFIWTEMKFTFFFWSISLTSLLFGQRNLDSLKQIAPAKKWYEQIQLRGYMQVRYNGLLQTNEDLACEQCDRSWGGDNDFFIRRMRLIFYG